MIARSLILFFAATCIASAVATVGRPSGDVVLLILWGQSNADGRGWDGTSVTNYSHDGNIRYSNAGGALYDIDTVATRSLGATRFDIGIPFARTLTGEGYRVIVCKRAVGGTELNNNWVKPANRAIARTSTSLDEQWEMAIAESNVVYETLIASGDTIHPVLIYYQAAASSNSSDVADVYGANLATLIADFRADFAGGGFANCPVIVMQPLPFNTRDPGSKSEQDTVASAIDSYVAADGFAITVGTDAPGGISATWQDGSTVHIDSVTADRLGVDVANAWLSSFVF